VNHASYATVRMSGELDLVRREEIHSTLSVTSHGPPILVDLSEVTYADSTILAELLRFHSEAQRHGVRIALLIVSKQFARLVHYAGLSKAFAIFDSPDAARAYLESGSRE